MTTPTCQLWSSVPYHVIVHSQPEAVTHLFLHSLIIHLLTLLCTVTIFLPYLRTDPCFNSLVPSITRILVVHSLTTLPYLSCLFTRSPPVRNCSLCVNSVSIFTYYASINTYHVSIRLPIL